jgi:hypothetical protein
MRGLMNDVLRWLIGWGIGLVAPFLEGAHRLRIALAPRQQRRLRRRYGLDAQTPIQQWQDRNNRVVRPGDGAFAVTSGSTSGQKRVFYTKRRLRTVKWAYVDMFIRCCRAMRIRRRSLYVFSSLTRDESLTTLLLEERRLPSYFATLQAPYRTQFTPAIQRLAAAYGTTAVRLWVLALSNPGVLYSTNPSTLSAFFDDLGAGWRDHSRLVRDYCHHPDGFSVEVHRIARRLASRGSHERLARLAASDMPLPIACIAPSVEAFICWSGGYVRPFLDRLAGHLPSERHRHIPMYSMSTETIETVTHFGPGAVAFLPIAAGVCYEFLEAGADDSASLLRAAGELQIGTAYTMVVSDAFGLERYQTGDVFLCRGRVAGLPDLEFLRRSGVEYSFTGEKLTSDQLDFVYGQLRGKCPGLRADDFLTCVPSYPPGEHIPHYKVALVRGAVDDDDIRDEELAARADRLLATINPEYDSKRKSGRLGPVRLVRLTHAELAARVGGGRHRETWETQFKFLPLYVETWESRAST